MPTLQELEQEAQRRGIGGGSGGAPVPSGPNLQALQVEAERRGLVAPTPEVAAEVKPEFFGSSVIEPVAAIGSSIATSVAGGLGGAVNAINPFKDEGAGAETVEIAKSLAFEPKTQAGQEGLESFGKGVQSIIDKFNVPLSGIGGLVELVRAQGQGETLNQLQGLDQAVKTIEDVQTQGTSKTLGDRVFEESGSPLAATIAEVTPQAILDIFGFKTAKALPAKTAEVAEKTGTALAPVIKPIKEVAEGVQKFQTPAKREIARLLEEGSDFKQLAKFELVDDAAKVASPTPGLPTPELPSPAPTGIERFFDTKGAKVQTAPKAAQALKQGFKEGVIQPLKNSSKPDKVLMTQMTRIAERAKKDELFGMENRPGDVAGDLLMGKLEVIRKANKAAGEEIGKVVKTLPGEKIDVSLIGQGFREGLAEMGVKINENLQLDFKGSSIEGLSGPQNAISGIFNRMREGTPDAGQLHDLKKFIDEQVTFGKNAEGLAGAAERELKSLRFNINKTLGDKFPRYAEANKAYADTITTLDAFQDVAGRKMNLLGDNADKATGTLMRRLMSNAQSRITLLDALKGIDDSVARHGGFGGPKRIAGPGGDKNNLKMLVLYADELDRVFGGAPRTSLQGQFDQAFNTAARAATSKAGFADAVIGGIGKGVKAGFGINEENALKAILDLLGDKK